MSEQLLADIRKLEVLRHRTAIDDRDIDDVYERAKVMLEGELSPAERQELRDNPTKLIKRQKGMERSARGLLAFLRQACDRAWPDGYPDKPEGWPVDE